MTDLQVKLFEAILENVELDKDVIDPKITGIAKAARACEEVLEKGNYTFNEYQDAANSTNLDREKTKFNLARLTLGLVGEAGEVSEKIKKLLRGDKLEIDRDAMISELGDVLWYMTAIADLCDIKLEDVARYNVKKLADRAMRGKIRGSGDSR